MCPGFVEVEVGGDRAGTLADALEFGDHVGQGLVVVDDETGVARRRAAVAFALGQARQDVLEPDPFGDCGVLSNPIGVVIDATRRRRASSSDRPRTVLINSARLRSSMLSSRRRSAPMVIRGIDHVIVGPILLVRVGSTCRTCGFGHRRLFSRAEDRVAPRQACDRRSGVTSRLT